MLLCPPADFTLDEIGNARAPAAGDIYFSSVDGLAEARLVFLKGARLPERWRGCPRFTVAELGLGTGLNISALIDAWRSDQERGGWLEIVSIEGRPLTYDQAKAALACWPELKDTADKLLNVWPPPWKGVHRRRIDDLKVSLTFIYDDVISALEQADFEADAWFLDGFSPAKNPEMWSEAVFGQVARLSAPQAKVASFSVAGVVRRGLAGVGFRVDKCPGFGRKRERLEATRVADANLSPNETKLRRASPAAGEVVVVGGGVAAASLAHALSARGREVQLVSEGGLAVGASGAPVGLLTPRLEAADRPHVRLTMSAFAYSRSLFSGWEGFFSEGVFRFGGDDTKRARLEKIARMLGTNFELVDGSYASQATGVGHTPHGLHMKMAARFEPAKIVRQLVPANVRVIEAEVTGVRRAGDIWQVLKKDGCVIAEAPILVLAGGARMVKLAGLYGVDLYPGAGRLSLCSIASGMRPKMSLTWGGYISPVGSNVLLGATHVRGFEPGEAEKAHAFLRGEAFKAVPLFASQLGPSVGSWAGVRATSIDRLPLGGELRTGLYILSGLGARGFAHAPLLGEVLAGDLDGAPSGMERKGMEAVHPGRFALRRARR